MCGCDVLSQVPSITRWYDNSCFASMVRKEERTTHRTMYITLNLERKTKNKKSSREMLGAEIREPLA